MAKPASTTVTTVAGRRVKIARGTKSQTVNICTLANEVGIYELRYRLDSAVDVTTAELAELADLDALEAWLLARGGSPEAPGASSAGSHLVPRISAPPADDDWVLVATAAVDRAVTALVELLWSSSAQIRTSTE